MFDPSCMSVTLRFISTDRFPILVVCEFDHPDLDKPIVRVRGRRRPQFVFAKGLQALCSILLKHKTGTSGPFIGTEKSGIAALISASEKDKLKERNWFSLLFAPPDNKLKPLIFGCFEWAALSPIYAEFSISPDVLPSQNIIVYVDDHTREIDTNDKLNEMASQLDEASASCIDRDTHYGDAALGPILSAEKQIGQALVAYYAAERNLQGNAPRPYRFRLGKQVIGSALLTKDAWLDLKVDLSLDEPCYQHAPHEHTSRHLMPTEISKYRSVYERQGIGGWNDPVYRLCKVHVTNTSFNASFRDDWFADWRFSVGLLREELIHALEQTNENVSEVIANRGDLLPARERWLPDTASFENYNNRICIGGPVCLFALARKEQKDYALIIQDRSKEVTDGRNCISVVPQGIHQKMGRIAQQIPLSLSCFRELYEELFGGVEVKRTDIVSSDLQPDWFMDRHLAMRWFRDNLRNRDKYCMRMTCYGIESVSAAYNIGVLLVVHDPGFWERYVKNVDGLDKSWETDDLHCISSLDRKRIHDLLKDERWTVEGLCPFLEGLKQLKDFDADRVISLEDITVLSQP